MGFATIGDLLQGRAADRGLGRQVQAAMILEFFSQAVKQWYDDQALQSMRALYVREGQLIVAVLSPVLAQDLKLREPQVIAHINSKAGAEVVTSLRFLS